MMAKKKTVSQLSYEEAFQELETTVHQLESGELPLEDALNLFERGQKLASRCSALLEKAELKLRQLMPEDDGSFTETEFEPE
jgi:exodeoxyribonuclease VII small subunit